MTLQSILILKETVFILLELFLSGNCSSAVAPEVASVVKIDVEVVHASCAPVAVNTACVDVDV